MLILLIFHFLSIRSTAALIWTDHECIHYFTLPSEPSEVNENDRSAKYSIGFVQNVTT